MELLIGLGIFAGTVLLIEGIYLTIQGRRSPERRRVRRELRVLSFESYGNEGTDITRKKIFSEVPWLNRLLQQIHWTQRINRVLEQAGTRRPLGFFILLTVVLTFTGYLVGSLVVTTSLVSLLLSVVCGILPVFYLFARRKRRMGKFQRQLPEALELIARALKAGHAFPGGLKMVADEFDDPIGPEFDKTLQAVNFGISMSDALKDLIRRVECPDLMFFVISVLIQKETGGNLAEILDNIGYLIRERFKLQGHIRALSAEGRLSAILLILLPFLVAFVLFMIRPDYVQTLLTDPIGKFMLLFAALQMSLGVLIMRKMIQIEV